MDSFRRGIQFFRSQDIKIESRPRFLKEQRTLQKYIVQMPLYTEQVMTLKIKYRNSKKKEPIKRVYRTRYKIAEERIREILGGFNNGSMQFQSVEQLWNMSSKVSVEGAQYLRHNKDMRETFNRKMREFGRYDSKFLTLIKK